MSWPPPPYQWAAAPPPLPNFNPPSVDPHPPPSPSSFYGAQNFPHFPPVAQPQYSIQAGEFHSGDDGLPLPASTSVDWYRPAPPAYSGHEDGLVGSSSSHGQYLDLNLASVAMQHGFQGSGLTGPPPQGIPYHAAPAELITSTTTSSAFVRGYIKKYPKKPKTAKVVQSAFCEVCKIDCCSSESLQKHRLGKKHQKNLEKPRSTVVQSAFCEICNVFFGSSESLKEHRLGKNHQRNLEHVNGGPIYPNPVIGPPENPNKEVTESKKMKANSQNNVEAKRRRVLEGGASADSLIICSICNIVCNSDIVFSDHVAGKVHAAMLKKMAVVKSQPKGS